MYHLSLCSIFHRFHPYGVAVNVVGYHLVLISAVSYMWKLSSLIGVNGVIVIVYLDAYVFLFGECSGLLIVVACLFLLLSSLYVGLDLG